MNKRANNFTFFGASQASRSTTNNHQVIVTLPCGATQQVEWLTVKSDLTELLLAGGVKNSNN